MAVLDILTWPDPRLKKAAHPVVHFNDSLHAFISDLEDTLYAGPAAVGIAAPQVGVAQRIVIINVNERKNSSNHGRQVLINPEITHWGGSAVGREGCLSVPDYTGNVMRAAEVKVTAENLQGQPQTWQMTGFEARVVQHEIDHLDGLLFLDRLVSRRHDLFRRKHYR